MPFCRRHFIFAAVIGFFALFLPRLSTAASRVVGSKRRRVIVVGGGIAGLSAADLARRKGCVVTVLEASDRIGGKAFGTTLDGRFFDVGGQAYNKDMSRIAKLGRRLGLKTVSRPPQEPFFFDGEKVLAGSDLQPFNAANALLCEKAEALFGKSLDPAERISLAKISVLTWAKEFLPEKFLPQFQSYFESEWCESPDHVSLLHYLDYSRDFPSDESDEMATRFEQGMAGIAAGLAAELGEIVQTGAPVEKMISERERIRVFAKGRELIADDVILAIPMPQLSKLEMVGEGFEKLQEAARSYKGSAVRKIIFHYERPFWKDRARDGVFSHPSGLSMMENSDLATKFYSIVAFVGGPSVFLKIDRESLLEAIASVVGEEAKSPLGVVDHEWVDQEFLPGGYCSNRPPGENACLVVPKSVGRVYLAGSEISSEFPSYVEGALASAEDAVSLMMRSV